MSEILLLARKRNLRRAIIVRKKQSGKDLITQVEGDEGQTANMKEDELGKYLETKIDKNLHLIYSGCFIRQIQLN